MSRIAALALVVLAACSGGGPTDTPAPFVGPEGRAPVSLRNATGESLVYVAAGEGTLALLDLRPAFGPGEYDARLVLPGETVPVTDVIGYLPELGVNFFLYRVDAATGVAHYARSLLVPPAELARHAGLVTITPSRL
jgi:hypothetical protein